MHIAISTPDLDSGDAVSNDVIGMYQAFIESGYEVKIFASNTNIITPNVYKPEYIKDFLNNSEDMLIYHHSVGWDMGINILRSLKCRKVIKYHNVTPPEFFKGLAKNYVSSCQSGRKQVEDIIRVKADLYIACSEYSKHELITAGADEPKCKIVPPFHHIARLEQLKADVDVINRFDNGKTNVLMVGRVVPNKGHSALIDAFNIYHREYNINSRLLIVGKEDPGLISYIMSLHLRLRELSLENSVLFAGRVSDEALKAYYLVADVFMITSMHEGFCVPLVEAMSMKIPVVAYGSSAVPETVGKAGLVWDEHDPELMAASVGKIVRDEHVRLSLGEMGWKRYQNMFTNDKIEACLFEALENSRLIN